MGLVVAISFGTAKIVNKMILNEAKLVGAERGCCVWVDHYFEGLGLMELGMFGGAIQKESYVSTITVCRALKMFCDETSTGEVILVCAPPHYWRVRRDFRKLGIPFQPYKQFLDTPHQQFYSRLSTHPQTWSPLRWWKREIPLLSLSYIWWGLYARITS